MDVSGKLSCEVIRLDIDSGLRLGPLDCTRSGDQVAVDEKVVLSNTGNVVSAVIQNPVILDPDVRIGQAGSIIHNKYAVRHRLPENAIADRDVCRTRKEHGRVEALAAGVSRSIVYIAIKDQPINGDV